ncbi:MAG: 23S rRNA (guanosine(2251)-2'-O)-methyltransferase RlmB [Anaerolineales bacterium]|nr:23S rRNA (guanosine(2251)-2'-O)-methyltransferase RlmB [Anaerolineales bacterium]
MAEWIYGRNPVYEVLTAARRDVFELRLAQGTEKKGRIADIQKLCQEKKIPVKFVPRQDLDNMLSDAPGSSHQGLALRASEYPYSDLDEMLYRAEEREEPPFLLLLDTLQDPHNLGTLLRTAEAVGVHGVVMPLRRTATVTPAVVNASSGASEHLLVTQANLAQAIKNLKDNDVWVIGLDGGRDSQPPDRVRLDGAIALVVGNEGEGMRRLVRESCDLLLRLPMRGRIESLNAAAAGTVALYLAWGARGYD